MSIAGLICLCMISLSGCSRKGEEILLEDQLSTEAEQVSEETEVSEADKIQAKESTGAVAADPTVTSAPTEIFVDVCGAVTNPGVYEMEADSRVFQAIEAAGGMLPEAAGTSVNQAQPVSDGQQIYVPTKDEIADGTAVLPAEIQQQGENGQQETKDGKVNLNTADTETLKTLSGIGDSKAQAIVAWREENGRFSSIEDIMQVPGIKESTFTKIKDKIAIE